MKRETPTWRIPAGILALVAGLVIYALLIAWLVAPIVTRWHALLQLPVWVFLGIVWIMPLRRFLAWMETGHWTPPKR